MDPKNIKILPSQIEGIDANKLKIVVFKNWLWLVLIFFIINSITLLTIRYAREIYESSSVIRLDTKKDATELGIKSLTSEAGPLALISGEIEMIQSKLFLNRLLDSLDLNLNFYSVGRVLSYDLYGNPPAFITYDVTDLNLYNIPIYYDPIDETRFSLRINDIKTTHEYGKKITLQNSNFTFIRNKAFHEGSEIGYFFILNSREALLDYLSASLKVEPLNVTANTIRVSFKDNNPIKAFAIVDRISNLYLSYSYSQKNLANKQKIDWVTNELDQIEKQMESYENYFEDFTLKNKTNNLDLDLQRTIVEISKIDSQRFTITRKINSFNQLSDDINVNNIAFSDTQLSELPAYLIQDFEQIEILSAELERLKLSYNEVTFPYREKTYLLANSKTKILKSLGELKKSHLKKLQDLNQRKLNLEEEFAGMPDKKTEFDKKRRFYKLYEEFYLTLMKSKSEFEITQAGSTPDFKILYPATQPVVPLWPNKAMIAGIGLTSSLVLIVFLIALLYIINNKVTNITELEKITNVPVLGFVHSYPNSSENSLHVIDHPRSIVSEAIRTLRTNLDFFSVKSTHKVITISSTVSGEGKSFIATNLGGVIALSNKKVILLDLDMRKPKTDLPVPVSDRSKGISTILIGKNHWTECVVKTTQENFDYLPSGPIPPNPSELLLNATFANFLEELRKNYDFIIIDTPPVGLVTDGIMAMKLSDISIYIFRSNYSNKDFLANLKRIININKFSNVTTVLNALPTINKKGYGYGYYEETVETSWLKSLFKRK